MNIAERLRINFEEKEITYSSAKIKLTASFGIASSHNDIDMDELFKEADKALYCAKNSGRNQVYYSPQED